MCERGCLCGVKGLLSLGVVGCILGGQQCSSSRADSKTQLGFASGWLIAMASTAVM